MPGDERAEDVKAVFAKKRRFQQMLSIPLLVVLAALVGVGNANHTLLGVPALAVVGLSLIVIGLVLYFSLRNWRCPACGTRLPPEGAFVPLDKCSKCGAKLS